MKLVLIMSVMLCCAYASLANIIYVDGSKLSRGDGKSWNTAYNNLSDALRDPHANVWVKKGTYKLTDNFYSNGLSVDADDTSYSLSIWSRVYGGFNGTETSVTQRDYNQNKTILSGLLSGGLKSKTIATLSGSNALVDGLVFSYSSDFGLKLTGSGFLGTVQNCTFENHEGTALRTHGNSSFSNCVFKNNTIAFASIGGEITLKNSFFINNPGRHATMYPAIDFDDTWGSPYQVLLIDTTYNRAPKMSTIVQSGAGNPPQNMGSNIYTYLGDNSQNQYFRNINNPYGNDGILGTSDDGFRLRAGSPYIDNGKNSEVKSDVINLSGVKIDASGVPRVYGNSVDQGLYEYDPSVDAVDNANNNQNGNSVQKPNYLNIDNAWGWMKLPWVYSNGLKNWVYLASNNTFYSYEHKAWYKKNGDTWELVK